ncbi:MAG: hypothetical protein ACJAW3_001033 [Lentimonas sp.]|jgi:hypothetical protein
MAPDEVVVKYFPNAEIIHIISCEIGGNIRNNLAENYLKDGQVMFVHSGGNSVTDVDIAKKLASPEINYGLPAPSPLQIIFNHEGKSKILSVSKIPYSKITKGINFKDNEAVFDALNKYYEDHKSNILKNIKSYPEEIKSLIKLELEKLGFSTKNNLTPEEKKSLVE